MHTVLKECEYQELMLPELSLPKKITIRGEAHQNVKFINVARSQEGVDIFVVRAHSTAERCLHE